MRVALSFLSSLIVHLAIALSFLAMKPGSVPLPARINVKLPEPVLPPDDVAEHLTTAPKDVVDVPEPPESAPPPRTTQRTAQGTPSPNAPAKPAVIRQAQKKLMEKLLYPPEAVRRGLEGEAIVLLTLGPGGAVSAVSLARSSGHTVLDEAAVSAARQLGSLRGSPGQILLPVQFALD